VKVSALVLSLVLSASTYADDTQRALFADSAAVATARPIGLSGALRRLGSGWEAAARHALRLPSAVSPFDPTVMQTTGVDPAGVIAVGVRPLRGGLHVRAAVPLVEARVADALLQTLAGLGGATVERSASAWTAKLKDGTPLVARTQGTTLVVDVVLGNATMVPTPADVLRVVPLKPPRAFSGTRGLQKRMTAEDAFALWADLDALGKLGLQRTEADMSQALKGVEPKMRAKLVRQSQTELSQCKQAFNTTPRTFDDVLVALRVASPNQLRLEVAESGRKAALDALRTLRQAPTRALGDCGDADVCVSVTGPPIPRPSKVTMPIACTDSTRLVLAAESWPALLGSEKGDESMWKVVRGLRGLSIAIPGSDAGLLEQRRYTMLAELDPAVRGDLDKLVQDARYDATTPLRVGVRSVTTYGSRYGGNTAPVAAVDAEDGATIVGVGPRELVGPALEKVHPVVVKAAIAGASIGTATIVSRGIRHLQHDVDAAGRYLEHVDQVDASLTLDDDVLRLDADVTLHATPAGK